MPNQKGWTMTIANTVTNDDEDIDLDIAERLAEQTDHDSLLADLSKTFDEVDNDLVPVADKEAAQAPVEKTAAERARDELGRFTAAERALQEAATKAAKADETPTQTQAPTGEPVKPQPPTSWSPAAKAAFAELPQDHPLVQAVAKRESEVNAGFAELKNYKELKHYSELAKSKGDTLPGMLQRFVAAEDLLSKNPTQGIMWLMRSYGVHPAYIAQQAGLNMVPPGQVPQVPRQSPQAKMSPQQLAYQQQQHTLMQQAQQKQRQQPHQAHPEIASLKQQVEEMRRAPLVQEVDRFLTDPKYPFAHNLKDDMALLLDQGKAVDLPSAYEMASWANPETRALLIKQQREEATKSIATRAKAATSTARSASKSLTGAPLVGASSTPAAAELSIEDQLAAGWDNLV
jgi:hypothetical protein